LSLKRKKLGKCIWHEKKIFEKELRVGGEARLGR